MVAAPFPCVIAKICRVFFGIREIEFKIETRIISELHRIMLMTLYSQLQLSYIRYEQNKIYLNTFLLI